MLQLVSTIDGQQVNFKAWTFPGGERGLTITDQDFLIRPPSPVQITVSFKSSDDIIDLSLMVDAIRQLGVRDIRLYVPYFPYARQDRSMARGDSHGLRAICAIINTLGFSDIVVYDPHSDVLEALLPASTRFVRQHDIVAHAVGAGKLSIKANDIFLSPDAGALKKIYAVRNALIFGNPVICANKSRDSVGKIVAVEIDYAALVLMEGQRVWIIDDICDGGASFISIAEYIRGQGVVVDLNLFVTHGIFSKGKEVLQKHFTEVVAYFDMKEGKTL